jgi:hypothetical protein
LQVVGAVSTTGSAATKVAAIIAKSTFVDIYYRQFSNYEDLRKRVYSKENKVV